MALEEALAPYFRLVLAMIVIGCLILVFTALTATDGPIATNINALIDLCFDKASTAIQ